MIILKPVSILALVFSDIYLNTTLVITIIYKLVRILFRLVCKCKRGKDMKDRPYKNSIFKEERYILSVDKIRKYPATGHWHANGSAVLQPVKLWFFMNLSIDWVFLFNNFKYSGKLRFVCMACRKLWMTDKVRGSRLKRLIMSAMNTCPRSLLWNENRWTFRLITCCLCLSTYQPSKKNE